MLNVTNRRGALLETGAVVLILLTTLGVGFTFAKYDSPLYVGVAVEEPYYFDYFTCSELRDKIPNSELIVFESKNDAELAGFMPVEGCV